MVQSRRKLMLVAACAGRMKGAERADAATAAVAPVRTLRRVKVVMRVSLLVVENRVASSAPGEVLQPDDGVPRDSEPLDELDGVVEGDADDHEGGEDREEKRR